MASKSEMAELREENRLLRLQVSELLQKLTTYLEVQGVSAATCAIMNGRQNAGQKLKSAAIPKKTSHVQQRVQSINASVAASSGVAPSAAVHGSATTKGPKQKQIAEAPIAVIPGWEAVATRKKKQTLPEAGVK